jgi:adenylate kinase family enzyme
LAAKLNLPPAIVIQIDLPDDVARQRLAERRRVDDTPELVEERLKNYHREMDMIRSYYPEANIWTINGDKPVAMISSTIEAILNDEMPKP